MGEEKVKEMLGQVLEESYAKAQAKQKAEGYIKLERGFATIPLPGIDVPFHSRYLWAGVMPFRACMPRFLFYPVHHCSPSFQTFPRRSTQLSSTPTCSLENTSQSRRQAVRGDKGIRSDHL
jgi:hypothetical protein